MRSKGQQRDGGRVEMRGHWNSEYDAIARIPAALGTGPIKQHFGRPVNAVVDATTGTFQRNDRKCGWPDPVRLAWQKFGYLQVQKGKSPKTRRTVSLTARVRDTLAARSKKSASEFVFPGKDGKPILVTSLDHQHAKMRGGA